MIIIEIFEAIYRMILILENNQENHMINSSLLFFLCKCCKFHLALLKCPHHHRISYIMIICCQHIIYSIDKKNWTKIGSKERNSSHKKRSVMYCRFKKNFAPKEVRCCNLIVQKFIVFNFSNHPH